jgi:putative phosphoribosyl transferase
MNAPAPPLSENGVVIPAGDATLEGELVVPSQAEGVVIFVHGSGSSRHSPRNQYVARTIREAGMGTLLFDLLTADEERQDNITRALRFDIDLLTRRLIHATRWYQSRMPSLPVAFFGASTGAAAALAAAAELGKAISAVVSRGGRPDLAGRALERVVSPTLLIVGGFDDVVISLNESALESLRCSKEMQIIPGATHLFEEPGALEQVAQLATEWFSRHFSPDHSEDRK